MAAESEVGSEVFFFRPEADLSLTAGAMAFLEAATDFAGGALDARADVVCLEMGAGLAFITVESLL